MRKKTAGSLYLSFKTIQKFRSTIDIWSTNEKCLNWAVIISFAFSSTTSWIFSLKESLLFDYYFQLYLNSVYLMCLNTNFFPNQLRGPSPLSPMWIDPGFPTSNSSINVKTSIYWDDLENNKQKWLISRNR